MNEAGFALLLAAILVLGLDACGSSVTTLLEEPEPENSKQVESVQPTSSLLEVTASDLSVKDAFKSELTVTLDGADKKVTVYEDCYVSNPTSYVQRASMGSRKPIVFATRPVEQESVLLTDFRVPENPLPKNDNWIVLRQRSKILLPYRCRLLTRAINSSTSTSFCLFEKGFSLITAVKILSQKAEPGEKTPR